MVVLGIYRKQTIKGGTRIHSVGVDFFKGSDSGGLNFPGDLREIA